jgi:multimeric flavodoxin WrbA
MRLLAIHGSPRKGGNTEVLLDCFLEGASGFCESIDRVSLRDLEYTPCTECDGCQKTGQCVFNDMLGPLFDKLLSFERVVFSYPLFFLGPPAITKAFIDRGQFLWVRKYIMNIDPVSHADERAALRGTESGAKQGAEPGALRTAFLLSVGGFKGGEKVFRCNRTILKSFLPVCGLSYAGEIFQGGIEHRGDVRLKEDLCERAREAGRFFVQ